MSEHESKFNPDKGYVALLGWSLNAVEAAEAFDIVFGNSVDLRRRLPIHKTERYMP